MMTRVERNLEKKTLGAKLITKSLPGQKFTSRHCLDIKSIHVSQMFSTVVVETENSFLSSTLVLYCLNLIRKILLSQLNKENLIFNCQILHFIVNVTEMKCSLT